MAEILDLRGRRRAPDRTPVLLDPTGGRARVLAWAGRAVAVVFLIWLIGLVFAGLGLLPSGDVPLGHALVASSPPALKVHPRVTQPGFAAPPGAAQQQRTGRTALAAAKPAAFSSTRNAATSSSSGTGSLTPAPSKHGKAPAHNGGATVTSSGSPATTATPAPASQTNNGLHAAGSGPGRTVSQSSPGHTKSSSSNGSSSGAKSGSSGQSGSSSGHGHQSTTTTVTTPGKSGSAPGRTTSR